MGSSSASILILCRRLLGQKSQAGKQDGQGLMEADFYFPKTARSTDLKKKITHTGEKTIDDSRNLTDLHLGSKLFNCSGGIQSTQIQVRPHTLLRAWHLVSISQFMKPTPGRKCCKLPCLRNADFFSPAFPTVLQPSLLLFSALNLSSRGL